MNKPMGIILLNPEKENMVIREGIVRALRWLNSQDQQWLFWIAETSSVNGRSVCSMFSVRSTADSMLFLLPSTTWKPTLVKQLHDNNLTEVDVQDRLSEIVEKTRDAIKVLSAQREQLGKFRAEREEQDNNFRQAQLEDLQTDESDAREAERQINLAASTLQDNEKKARKSRLSDEPEDGVTIRIRASTGTLARKFKRGAHFQEVYDWAGTIEFLPHYFTLHRGKQLVSHPEKVNQDETLNLTERDETEMETYFHSKVSFKGDYQYSEGVMSKTLEDAQEDGEGDIEEDRKNDGNIEVPDTSLEKKKRKRKNNRTTAQRLKKRKEKEGKTDN